VLLSEVTGGIGVLGRELIRVSKSGAALGFVRRVIQNAKGND
jgi:hypothetical protein